MVDALTEQLTGVSDLPPIGYGTASSLLTPAQRGGFF